ncbi:MAG: hypothetical protein AAF307_05255 [Pseudomonadota bacterium]
MAIKPFRKLLGPRAGGPIIPLGRGDPILARLEHPLSRKALALSLNTLWTGAPDRALAQTFLRALDAEARVPRHISSITASLLPGIPPEVLRASHNGHRLVALALREEKRAQMVFAQWQEVQAHLIAHGVHYRCLRGPAFGTRWFPKHSLRHSHGATLVIPDNAQRDAFATHLRQTFGYQDTRINDHQHVLSGKQRLEIDLRPAPLPFATVTPLAALSSVSDAAEILVNALWVKGRGSGRWMLDLALLVKHRQIAPETLAAELGEIGIAARCHHLLTVWRAAQRQDANAELDAVNAALARAAQETAERSATLRALEALRGPIRQTPAP